ncbi:class I glutamine amidotransferase-like protein [Aspergillus avenaceus]|uniref:Class I glutamine amidotransferase-like protein n=1 Tax=Aspergillus avenaceus TaxID=36643 RepID=A0A5N6TX60_ASPAV|nr:class I glutamine amidotransferase-like protein [Aspergillus avenaceus]
MTRNIHIAVLDVDIPPRELYEAHGLCSAHFRNILQATASRLNQTSLCSGQPIRISVTPYDIRGGHYPDFRKLRRHPSRSTEDENDLIDAVLITGGSPGVYEMEVSPWMQVLQKFLHTVFDDYPLVKILGTCFGHQLIGHALLGKANPTEWDVFVEKCPLGREVGIYTVAMEERFVGAFPHAVGHLAQGQLKIQMFHGDRVIAVRKDTNGAHGSDGPQLLPEPWVNVGSTPICPIQGLYHPDRVLSVQGHYELSACGMQKMCLDFAPRFGWNPSKLAIMLEQVGTEPETRQDDAESFATAVVCFLAGIVNPVEGV